MIPQDKIKYYENEIYNILKEVSDYKNEPTDSYEQYKYIENKKEDVVQKIDHLIENTPLGSLSDDFFQKVDSNKIIQLSNSYKLYKELAEYIEIKDIDKKRSKLSELEEKIAKINKNVWTRRQGTSLSKSVYTSGNSELIDLFYKNLPIPPLSLFDENHQPPILVKDEIDKNNTISKFKERNINIEEKELNRKINYLQRHIRRAVRMDSDIERISNRYYKDDPEGKIKAEKMIQEANTPYLPKECDQKLSKQIVAAASKIKLYDSLYHLLAANKIHVILDDALYGRSNLINSYKDFRGGALYPGDIDNGDGNVICLGPDKIDPQCLKGRTIGLELNLDTLMKEEDFNKNPSMFFKQTDLGFSIGNQEINIGGNYRLRFNQNGLHARLNYDFQKYANLHFLDATGKNFEYLSIIQKDLLISSNVREIDKILILNFFRYLDNLKSMRDRSQLASGKIKEIYEKIGELNDEELISFLTDLGRKMSCTSEFNFSGAYKIDLNSIKSITSYQGDKVVDKIEITDLVNQLNSGDFELFNRLRKNNPEIFKSKNFVEFLLSKIESQETKQAVSVLITDL